MGYKARALTQEERSKALNMLSDGIPRKEIAAKLKINYTSLKNFYESENIPSRKDVINREDQDEVVKLYLSGLSFNRIHTEYFEQYTNSQLNYFIRNKCLTRSRGKQVVLNHDYFENIDTEEKAYWLGLILSDGNVQRTKRGSYCISISLQKEDAYLLERFAKAVGSDKKVKFYKNTTGYGKKEGFYHIESRIVVYSKKMFDDLAQHGVLPQKSLRLKCLPNISKALLKHCIRGYFDGNGSATYSIGKRGQIVPKAVFYGTHSFLSSIEETLRNDIGFTQRKITDQKKARVSLFGYGKYNDVKQIYDYFYKDATIYMLRKKEKMEKYLREYRDK